MTKEDLKKRLEELSTLILHEGKQVDDKLIKDIEDSNNRLDKCEQVDDDLVKEIEDIKKRLGKYEQVEQVTIITGEVIEFNIELEGIGNDVFIDFGDGERNNYLLTQETTKINKVFRGTPEQSHEITILHPENITKLYASNCAINFINLENCVNLEEIVLNNNDLSELIINSEHIKRVHIMNNPICSDEEKMTTLIESLPDRNGDSYGSIIMYDFVPYGETESQEHKDLVVLRKKLESITIPKDWYFGSAIIYNETEYDKTTESFKYSNVADIWESAEQGEGIVIGFNETGVRRTNDDWDLSNFSGTPKKVNVDTQIIEEENDDILSNSSHSGNVDYGDACASLIISNGRTSYGIAPKSKIYEVRRVESQKNFRDKDMSVAINHLSENSDIIAMTQPITNGLLNGNGDSDDDTFVPFDTSEYQQAVKAHIDSGKPYVITTGNEGDGNPTTKDTHYDSVIDNVPDVIATGGFGIYHYALSISTIDTDNTLVAENLRHYVKAGDDWTTSADSCFGAVEVSAKIALYMVLYEKKYGTKPNNNEIRQFIITRSKHLNECQRKGVGVGHIDFNNYNKQELNRVKANSMSLSKESIDLKIGDKLVLPEVTIAPSNTSFTEHTYCLPEDSDIIDYYGDKLAFREGSKDILFYSNDNPDLYKNFTVSVTKPSTQLVGVPYNTIYNEDSFVIDSTIDNLDYPDNLTIEIRVKDYQTNFNNMYGQNYIISFVDENSPSGDCREIIVYDFGMLGLLDATFVSDSGDVLYENFFGTLDYGGNIVFTFAYSRKDDCIIGYVNGVKTNVVELSSHKFKGFTKILFGNSFTDPDSTATPTDSTFGRVRVYKKYLNQYEVVKSMLNLMTE